jgi:hypothetical protein
LFFEEDGRAYASFLLPRRPAMKKKIQKMTLNKETLRLLEDPSLTLVEGGATRLRTECGSCPASACHPSFCETFC